MGTNEAELHPGFIPGEVDAISLTAQAFDVRGLVLLPESPGSFRS